MHYKRGDSVIIELQSGDIYDGVVYSETATILSLSSIVEYPTNKEIPHVCNFQKSNIVFVKNIRLLNKNENPSENCIFLSSGDYKIFTNAINSYKIYNEISDESMKALNYIQTYETIGVDAKGAENGRFNRISYLVFATHNLVYIFNIKKMGKRAFDTGIKQLLESEYPTKIVFDSRSLKDCLKHHYDVEMINIFDVKTADYTLQAQGDCKNIQSRSLQECVECYLNLPKNMVDDIKSSQWEQANIPDSIKDMIAVKACILLFLHQLIQRRMLYTLNTITNRYYDSILNSDQIPPGQNYFPSGFFT